MRAKIDPQPGKWSLERVLFALAGTVTVTSGLLSVLKSRWFGLLSALVGANQWLYVATGSCPASLILRRSCHLQSVIYDNGDRAEGRVKEMAL
jgi:hypothetical protein